MVSEIGWQTKQMKQLYRSLLDWAEYAYVLLFITIVITVLVLFWATNPKKSFPLHKKYPLANQQC